MEVIMKHVDLKKELKACYTASATKPSILQIPAFGCLMVDGIGDPGGQAFQAAVGALYSVAYTLKFTMKKEHGIDYPVMGFEGLWSADDFNDYRTGKRDRWKWTLLMVLPTDVTKKHVSAAVEAARKKGKLPDGPEVRFQRFAEGRAAQIMHIGPYSAEGPTVERLHSFIEGQGYRLRGRHHEIYFGDPRRTAPEKLKTIIRYPVERVGARRS